MVVAGASGGDFFSASVVCLHQPAGGPDHRRYGAEPDGACLVLFFIRIIANQNTLQMADGDAASWFMIKKTMFGYGRMEDMGPLGETFINRTYLATYLCILLFLVLAVLLYKTRFGLRLRACGENPQAADSLGINVYKVRYAGTTISGALAGMGGLLSIP